MVSLVACSIDPLALTWYVCPLSFNAYLSEADEVRFLCFSSSAYLFLFGLEVCETEVDCRGHRYPHFFTLCGGTFGLKAPWMQPLGHIPSKHLVTPIPMPLKRVSKPKRSWVTSSSIVAGVTGLTYRHDFFFRIAHLCPSIIRMKILMARMVVNVLFPQRVTALKCSLFLFSFDLLISCL